VKTTIDQLAMDFPPSANALVGYIPMDYFTAHEAEIRKAMRDAEFGPLRIRWRGPRPGRKMDARRATAKAAVIYLRD